MTNTQKFTSSTSDALLRITVTKAFNSPTFDDETLRKVRLHQLARDLVNETVAGHVSDETAKQIAEISLPALKRQWVRDQVEGIRNARGEQHVIITTRP
jgi:hypothetical protein